MEKLIELLNEYDSGWDYDDYYGPYQYGQDRDAYIYGKYYLVSRDYGFIKWLVENNRIDGNKYDEWLDKEGVDMEYPALEKLPHKEAISMVMIMLLAIQDNPIEFLIKLIQ